MHFALGWNGKNKPIAILLLLLGLIVSSCGKSKSDTQEASCSGEAIQACRVLNGTGEQTRSCENGAWTLWSRCRITSCNAGYYLSDGRCQEFGPSVGYEIKPDPKTGNLLEFTVDSAGLIPPLSFLIRKVFKNGIEADCPDRIQLSESNGAFTWRPAPSQSAEYDFLFHITDSQSESRISTVHISVTIPEVCNSNSDACVFLRRKWDQGKAAGNVGDWYHNRDKFHSNLSLSEFPQLDLMTGGYGGAVTLYPGRVVVGNSSTAHTSGEDWMSQARGIMLVERWVEAAYNQYMNGHHYWYPEHNDHDSKDHYHCKMPYLSSTQGSSSSEIDEVRSFICMLAALPPAAKARLVETGLLMPTLQMVFRRAQVDDDDEYLTGLAHPSAFANHGRTMSMVEMANAIRTSTIPPMIQLEVIEESYSTVDGKREQWFTTPASICRIFRGPEYRKRIVVSAANSYDINNRPLVFRWVILRGDPNHVTIAPMKGDNSQAEILIDYHDETTIAGSSRLTNMVEVGVFAHNGIYYSAPGFITDFTLNNQDRAYDESGNLITRKRNGNYVHPLLD